MSQNRVHAEELPADEGYTEGVQEALNASNPAERDDALNRAGLLQSSELEFERADSLTPGKELLNEDYGNGDRFNVKVTKESTPNTKVIIYDNEGQPFIMTKEQAMMRLQKRFDEKNQFYPGLPCFYRRSPKPRAEPTFECPSVRAKHRRKFWSEDQAQRHYRAKHPKEVKLADEAQEKDRQERMIAAQERQAALMEKLLGSSVPKEDIEHVSASVENDTSEPDPRESVGAKKGK